MVTAGCSGMDLAGLKLHDIPQVGEADVAGSDSDRTVDGWALVIDRSGAPLGWIDSDGVRRHRAGAPLSASMAGVGALLRPDGNLSQALDCALSSPAAMGVAVDSAGKVVGGVRAGDVLTALESRKAEGRG